MNPRNSQIWRDAVDVLLHGFGFPTYGGAVLLTSISSLVWLGQVGQVGRLFRRLVVERRLRNLRGILASAGTALSAICLIYSAWLLFMLLIAG